VLGQSVDQALQQFSEEGIPFVKGVVVAVFARILDEHDYIGI